MTILSKTLEKLVRFLFCIVFLPACISTRVILPHDWIVVKFGLQQSFMR